MTVADIRKMIEGLNDSDVVMILTEDRDPMSGHISTYYKKFDGELGFKATEELEKEDRQEKINRYQRYIKNENTHIAYLMEEIKEYRKTLNKPTTKRIDYWENKIKEKETEIQECENNITEYQKEIEKIA